MPIYSGLPENIDLAAEQLASGEVVALPTETVYGLAANALNDQACSQIFNVKGRPLIDPLIVHIYKWEQADLLASPPPSPKFWQKTFGLAP